MAEISLIFHSSGILLLCRLRSNIFSNDSDIISELFWVAFGLFCFASFLYASWLSLSDSWLDLIVSCAQWIFVLISFLCTSANFDAFFWFFLIFFYSYGLCCFNPFPLLIILYGINLTRHTFRISVEWFHMSFKSSRRWTLTVII